MEIEVNKLKYSSDKNGSENIHFHAICMGKQIEGM